MAETQGPKKEARQDQPSRIAGKWQAPLFILSAILFAVALWHSLAAPKPPTWQERLDRVVSLTERVSAGDYAAAEAACRELQADTPATDLVRQGRLHAQLGEIQWRRMVYADSWGAGEWLELRNRYRAAVNNHLKPTADVAERLGRSYDALGDSGRAMEWYDRAMELDPARTGKLSRRAIELGRRELGLAGEDLLRRLRQFMRSEGLRPQDYGWALDLAVGELMESDQLRAAEALLQEELARVPDEAAGLELQYQQARVLVEQGLTQQAQDLLIPLADRLDVASELYPKANLLLGELTWRENPLEAQKAFANVMTHAPHSPLAVAAAVGTARAYSKLRLYEKAYEGYQLALEELIERPRNPYVDLPALRSALEEDYQALMDEGHPWEALRFVQAERKVIALPATKFSLEERVDVLERLARTHLAVAEQAAAELADAQRRLADEAELKRLSRLRADELAAAGEALIEQAEVNRSGGLLAAGAEGFWRAAEAFDKAGQRAACVRALQEFVAARPTDPRVPEARFRLAQTLQAAGRYDEAIEVYRANLASGIAEGRHPKAVEGLIPMALCYVAKGEEYLGEARQILQGVLDEADVITPQSTIYHGALFLLGRIEHRQGMWAEARLKLDEAVQRSPGELAPPGGLDADLRRREYLRATRAMFLIADCDHQLARQVAREARSAVKIDRRREFQRAAEELLLRAEQGHARVIRRLEAMGETHSLLDEACRLNSYFARGDCLYELGRYAEAIERYEEAVFRFQRDPAALGGLMRMHLAHLALGEPERAAAAVERARALQKQLEPGRTAGEEFADTPLVLSEEGWDDWLDAVGKINPVIIGREGP